jgi:hypothetical protein
VSDIKPVLGEPDISYDYSEVEFIPCTPTVGWDIEFGCRINFGWDPDGMLRAFVSISDAAQRNGCAHGSVTPEQLEAFADQLKLVARAGLTPLQAHLASRHALANAHTLSDADARDYHAYEHGRAEEFSGGTIRDHPHSDLNFDAARAVAVIREGLDQ